MNKDFKAVIFDMDGVIFDSERLVVKCWEQIAKKYDIPDIVNTCKSCMGLNRAATKIKFRERYGEEFPYDVYKEEQRALFYSMELPIKEGVTELFEEIHKNNIKMALATSTASEIVVKELETAGLRNHFDAIVCGDMVKNSKPDPEIYIKAMGALNVEAIDCYGIEDSVNGVKSIAAAGIRAIMVPDMLEPDDEIAGMCEVVLPSLSAVKKYLFADVKN